LTRNVAAKNCNPSTPTEAEASASIPPWLKKHIGSVWRPMLAATILSAISAGLSFYIITRVGLLISAAEPGKGLLFALGLVPVLIGLSMIARTILSRVAHEITYRARFEIVRSIMEASVRRVEEVTPPRIYAAVTSDVHKVAAAFGSVPLIIFNALLLLFGAGLIASLSLPAFFFIFAGTSAGAGVSFFVQRHAILTLREERRTQDALFKAYQALIYGKKEFALSAVRRARFLGTELPETLSQARSLGVRADQHWEFLSVWNSSVLLGLLLSLSATFQGGANRVAVTQIALVVFYLQGPLAVMLDMVQRWTYARIAFANLARLKLDRANADPPPFGAEQTPPDEIRFSGIRFSYLKQGDEPAFSIGPIDLRLRRGEVTFITGGNGSGKTSLCRILCGLYSPSAGSIFTSDGNELDAAELRSHAVALFSDFYPFDHIPTAAAEPGDDLKHRVDQLLAQFRLTGKTQLDGARWSTTSLSSGQSRRLALISVLLEKKSLYIFDEPTADQDAEMRRFFHDTIIPDLKRRGKMIVIISHDENYFNTADRLHVMKEGRLLTPSMTERVE
jgi:putative ATP-binding cassette transporter